MTEKRFVQRTVLPVALLAAVGIAGTVFARRSVIPPPITAETPLSTGKWLAPTGSQTLVGSFPNHLVLSPDGKFVAVTSSGSRCYVTIINAQTGRFVSRVGFNDTHTEGRRSSRDGLYYGLVFGPVSPNGTLLYAARGADSKVSVLRMLSNGTLSDTNKPIDLSGGGGTANNVPFAAGLALSADGTTLYIASNSADAKAGMGSVVHLVDVATQAVRASVAVPGYPYAVAATTTGPGASKVYIGSEQKPVMSVLNTATNTIDRTIAVGSHPVGFALDRAQKRLFVANANSDTVSVVDTASDTVKATILLRPSEAQGLVGATPTGVVLSPDDKTLYVSLADMNAVAVVDVEKGAVTGYIPVGWYPTGVAVSPDGARLFVSNAKGVSVRTPNGDPVAVAAGERDPRYIQSILEGTVSTIDLADASKNRDALTKRALTANRFFAGLADNTANRNTLKNPGIEHIIYIIKENRTYDQVLGDLTQGNGDPDLVMFGRDVTPNQHALAERFVLLDNFYCAAEVSGDGWNWSTAGMANEFVARNVPYGYTGHEHPYDYEGTNNGVAVDRLGIPDAAQPAGGYLWDQVMQAGLSLRNYGFFADDLELPRTGAETGSEGLKNTPTRRSLDGKSDGDFRQFDMDYADSEAWIKHGLAPYSKQAPAYGTHQAPSRVSEWRREFDGFVKNKNLPRFQTVRLGNDHTSGTKAGYPTPRAFVADNDYAVGQLVEAVSHSSYWKSTAIFIVEDDAQNGQDHVDAHRAPALVISPFIRRGTRDNRFYNTDSMLHSMENLMNLPPLTQYVAIAPTLNVFTAKSDNDRPYAAILPAKSLVAERNTALAYRAQDSAHLYHSLRPDEGPDAVLNDILWHSVKGRSVPEPAPRYSLLSAPKDTD